MFRHQCKQCEELSIIIHNSKGLIVFVGSGAPDGSYLIEPDNINACFVVDGGYCERLCVCKLASGGSACKPSELVQCSGLRFAHFEKHNWLHSDRFAIWNGASVPRERGLYS